VRKGFVREIARVVTTLVSLKVTRLRRRLGLKKYERHLIVGRHTYGVIPETTVLRATADAPVTIGSFCSISAGVVIIAQAEHPTDLPSTFPFRSLMFGGVASAMGLKNCDAVARGPITIGHDVWIGQNAIVLSGVTIGTGAVIAAGSVVTKDIAPYEIVAGVPARTIRFRFSNDIVQRLLATRWWELPDAIIEGLEQRFYSRDIESFIVAIEECWDQQKRPI